MPLAPEARAVLDAIAAANRTPYEQLPPPEARRQFKEARGPLQPDPPEVASAEERDIPGPGGPLRVRSYRPLGSTARELLPGLVYFHGGGWTIGDLDTHDGLCRALANAARCAVVSVDYRLGPEHKFPAAVDDSVAATRWVAAEAARLGIDGGRLAVGGDSAGANLATVVAITARDSGGPRLAFQALIYPGTDIDGKFPSLTELGQGHLLTTQMMKYFRECYLGRPEDASDWRCSPLRAKDLSRLPPALVLTAEYDPLRDEGRAYAERLRESGVPVAYTCYPGMIHGFVTMGRVMPAAPRAIREIGAALTDAFATPARQVAASGS
jgi:acetyl esterase